MEEKKHSNKMQFKPHQLRFIAEKICPHVHWPTGIKEIGTLLMQECDDINIVQSMNEANEAWEKNYQSKQEEIDDWVE